MKIQSYDDRRFIRQFVALYSVDTLLVGISNREEEIGMYFYQAFADTKFCPVVFKHEGVWCININKESIPTSIKEDNNKIANIFEYLYTRVIERINLIEKLHNEQLIYFSKDIKRKYSVNIINLLPEARKIEDPILCELLDKYEDTKIYPSDELCRLVANNFRSDEEQKYWKQYYLSIIAVLVAIFLPIVINKCTSTKIDECQIEMIINSIEDCKIHNKQNVDSVVVLVKSTNRDTINTNRDFHKQLKR